MTPRPETVRDRLGDPASWPSVPEGFAPPSESYLLARLASASCSDRDVVIVMKAGEGLYQNTFEMKNEPEAELIVSRLQRRVGDLLLEALDEIL